MLYNMLIAVVGVVVLFGGWVLVQAFVRRHNPDLGDEPDVLACRMCAANGLCHCGLKTLLSTDPKKRVDLNE